MRVDILARRFAGPDGGPDGMSIAAGYLAWVLAEELGHSVRCYTETAHSEPLEHRRIAWRHRGPGLADIPGDWQADLVIQSASAPWRACATAARAAGALERLVYWHHHGELPPAYGGKLAAPSDLWFLRAKDWAWGAVLPPSSWSADSPSALETPGTDVVVSGIGAWKGGAASLEVARLCPELRFYALRGRGSDVDARPWRELANAEVSPGHVHPEAWLSRAGAVLSTTRAETYGLALVEAATRGIPVVCSDLPETRAALGPCARYVALDDPAPVWADALRDALRSPMPRLSLRRYADTAQGAIASLRAAGARVEASL